MARAGPVLMTMPMQINKAVSMTPITKIFTIRLPLMKDFLTGATGRFDWEM